MVGLALAGCALTMPVAAAQAQPGDTTVLTDGFESGTFANWGVTTGGLGTAAVQNSIGTNGSKAARLTVPSYNTNSIAVIKHTLAAPSFGVSASGRFKVLSGGCSSDAGYSAGNVPFLRFFDADGRRIAGLYRINGSCSKTAKLYVQHSGNFYRTGKNIGFGTVTTAELRIAVTEPSKSLVQVFIDGSKVYETTIADNGLKPVASVNVHNEHPDQVGDLIADDITIATFNAAPPTNPCNPAFALPSTSDSGTQLVADNFETFDFSRWSYVTREGGATSSIQTNTVHSGNCAALFSVPADNASRANLVQNTPAGTGFVYADGWFNVLAQGANTNSNVPYLRLFSGSTRIVDVYRVNGSGQMYLRLTPVGGSPSYHSLNRVVALNTWHQIKVYADASGNTSTVQVYYDGSLVHSTNVAPLNTSAINSVMIGSEHFAQEGTLAADDTVVKAGA